MVALFYVMITGKIFQPSTENLQVHDNGRISFPELSNNRCTKHKQQ